MFKRHLAPVVALALLLPLASLLSGCALTETATTHNQVPGSAISGVAMGGQQPIGSAKVYLLAANPAGYGSASLSLLTNTGTLSVSDSIGAYATSLPVTGSFNVAGAYDCTKGYALGATTTTATPTSLTGDEQVYLLVRGGNPGYGGTNNSIGLLAALGPCNAPYATQINVNELTTVAAAYAFAGFATDATHVASSGSSLARIGLANAGLNSSNLVSLTTGLPVANGATTYRPANTIYTLGNILAACVNGTTASNSCNTLFTYTESSGSTGTVPTDTATAAINLAHNPWPTDAGMTALFGLVPSSGAPFAGSFTLKPNDFTVAIRYGDGGVYIPYAIAIDGSGNAWTANYGNASISKLSPVGVGISPSAGYTGGGLNKPDSIAIDSANNAWVANFGGASVSEFLASGTAVSVGFTGGGIDQPVSIAIDGMDNVWIGNYDANKVSKLYDDGTPASYAGYTSSTLLYSQSIVIDGFNNAWAGDGTQLTVFSNNGGVISYTGGGGLNNPTALAADSNNNIFAVNRSGNSVSKFDATAVAVTTSSGYTGGGLNTPQGIAIDGSGNVWVSNYGGNSVTEMSNVGNAISPSTGYTSNGNYNQPEGIAIDGSGNVWVPNKSSNSVTVLIGAATPVVTPVTANISTPYSLPASRP